MTPTTNHELLQSYIDDLIEQEGFMNPSGLTIDNFQPGIKDVILSKFKEIQSRLIEPMGWISVSERLPEEVGAYMVCDIYLPKAVCAVSIGYYNRMGWDKKSYTHWQELPILPITNQK